eukprot:COSAG05_NODE_463_length_9555_cov_35.796108_9_plen_91_part_00
MPLLQGQIMTGGMMPKGQMMMPPQGMLNQGQMMSMSQGMMNPGKMMNMPQGMMNQPLLMGQSSTADLDQDSANELLRVIDENFRDTTVRV